MATLDAGVNVQMEDHALHLGGSLGDLAAEPPDSLVAATVADAARIWGVPIDSVTIVGAVVRTWLDRRLGSLPDRRAAGEELVPGWQITLTSEDRVAVYHTDGSRQFVRSDSGGRGSIV